MKQSSLIEFRSGPNATTFIVPGECFPTRYRSTSHGISAASGKIGAIVAQTIFGPLRTIGAAPGATGVAASPWLDHVMEIFALFMLLGTLTSLLIPETKRKTLEELAGEVPGTPNYDPVCSGHVKGYAARANRSANGESIEIVRSSGWGSGVSEDIQGSGRQH
jgi:PHS family inorganic phosphate transporter-like MFS transporter